MPALAPRQGCVYGIACALVVERKRYHQIQVYAPMPPGRDASLESSRTSATPRSKCAALYFGLSPAMLLDWGNDYLFNQNET